MKCNFIIQVNNNIYIIYKNNKMAEKIERKNENKFINIYNNFKNDLEINCNERIDINMNKNKIYHGLINNNFNYYEKRNNNDFIFLDYSLPEIIMNPYHLKNILKEEPLFFYRQSMTNQNLCKDKFLEKQYNATKKGSSHNEDSKVSGIDIFKNKLRFEYREEIVSLNPKYKKNHKKKQSETSYNNLNNRIINKSINYIVNNYNNEIEVQENEIFKSESEKPFINKDKRFHIEYVYKNNFKNKKDINHIKSKTFVKQTNYNDLKSSLQNESDYNLNIPKQDKLNLNLIQRETEDSNLSENLNSLQENLQSLNRKYNSYILKKNNNINKVNFFQMNKGISKSQIVDKCYNSIRLNNK